MKRQVLFFLAATTSGLLSSQVIIFEQNFDSFASGDLVAQTCGLPWSTWSVAPGGAEDTPISDEQASSGTLSAKVTGTAAGGPTDLILRLGNRTTGIYVLSWNMYIPSGNGGYFNMQHNEVPGAGSWMVDVTFAPGGTIEYLVNSVAAPGTFPHDVWFNVAMALDLDAMTGALAIDGAVQYTWQTNVPGPSQIGGIDFFGYAGGAPAVPLFYLDDVSFVALPSTSVPEVTPTEVGVYPNPAQDLVTVDLPNASTTATVSLVDVTGRAIIEGRSFQQQGTYARTQLSLKGLPDGLYFVRIQDGDQQVVRRVAKE
ncbi:MAG: T9SS type A sorting domain-containing protein [Flavobacteriales bacterium]